MKKRGFTLIELLAVIVILAIIALIAVPIVLGVIDKAKRGAFEDSVKVSSRQVEMYLFKNNLSKIPSDGVNVKDLDIKSDFTSGKFIEENGVVTAYFIKNKDYCAYGPVDNLLIKKDCNDLDISYPTIDESKLVTTSTSNSITVAISEGFAIDEESGIVKYEINIYDGSTKVDSETLNDIGNVTFKKLTNGKEYKIEVIVTNGNDMTSSVTKEVETIKVDKPTYSVSPSSDEKEWATSRTVTINYPEGYTNEYSLDGGKTWKPYTEPVVFTTSGTIIARIFDGVNYIVGSSQTVARVDSDKPTVSTFTYTRTSKSIKVTATGEDKTSDITYAFSKDNGSTWTDAQASNEYVFEELETGTYNIKVRVTDKAGNYLDSDAQSIDTVGISKPTYSINPSSGWATSKKVTIDYPSGYTNEYSLDGGETWKPYTNPVEFTTSGTIIARVNDGKNYVTASSQTVAQVDSDKPTVSTFTYTRTSKSIKVTATGEDKTSDITYAFSKDNGSTWTSAQTSNEYTFEELETGTYNIKVRVTDKAGNYLDSNVQSIDTVGISEPTYSINPSSGWATSKTVTINYPSGYTNEYSLDGGETWKPYTEPIVFLQTGTVVARVNDGKNYVTASSQTIAQVDSDKPTSSTFTYTRTSKSITAIANGKDATSNVSYAFSKDNGNTWTTEQTANSYTFEELETGTYNIKVRTYDEAGNYLDSETQSVGTIEIDKPTYSVSPSSGWATSKTVTINYPSGYTNEYSLDGATTWHSYTGPIVLTDIGATSATVIARVSDGKNYVTSDSLTVTEIYLTTAQNVSFTPDDANWDVDNVYEALEYLRNN